MRLVTYDFNGSWRSGIVIGEWVIDSLASAKRARLSSVFEAGQVSNRQIIQLPPDQQSELELAAASLGNEPASPMDAFSLRDILPGPPIPDPDKIICLGLNYRSHAEEAGFSVPEVPILFAKYRNTLNGATSPIILPGISQEIDYEAELAVVIGRQCMGVTEEDALNFVAGYMAFNDVSARDIQMRTSQWLAGKSLDTFAPCGPALVVNEIRDPQTLEVSTRVNGRTLQQGNTRDMIFPVAKIIAYISSLMTLQPGDIIATGTPDGVGFKRTPPIFLQHGDLVEVEIECIGNLQNPVIDPGLPD